jgi:hypothetical protein
MATVIYDINLEEMLLEIPAGPEREKAAIALDDFLGIPHIPTEGYEKEPLVLDASLKELEIDAEEEKLKDEAFWKMMYRKYGVPLEELEPGAVASKAKKRTEDDSVRQK